MPHLINGNLAVDDRGSVRFVNDFDFNGVKRFYHIENHARGFIRAWHGHKTEAKYIYVADGSALVGAANLDTEAVEKFVLSARSPKILCIPPNHANGFMTLEEGTKIIVFSSLTLAESQQDDIRFPHDKWNIWNIEYR